MQRLGFIIFFIFILSCDNSQKLKIKDIYRPNKTSSQLLDQLEEDFTLNSKNNLIIFFKEWNSSIPPNNLEFIHQSELIKSLYSVYKEFYKPFKPKDFGDWEKFHLPKSDSCYLVIQNKINYFVLDSQKYSILSYNSGRNILSKLGKEKVKINTIKNFRPVVYIDQKRVLYLEKEYDESLNRFLGSISSNEESQKRSNFLKPYINTLAGHWGKGWCLVTHPLVDFILFNDSLTKARIFFRFGYQGGESVLEKNENKWKLVKSESTWIE